MNRDELLAEVRSGQLSREAQGPLEAMLVAESKWTALALPPVVVREIELLEVGQEAKAAIRAVACGVPFRDAIRAVGVPTDEVAAVWRSVEALQLVSFGSDTLIQSRRRIAALADAEIERRLLGDPEDASLVALNIIGGTSIDKVLASERGSPRDREPLDSLLERLRAAGGGSVTLTVEQGKTIDVTPSREPHQ